ncbi:MULTISPECIES: SDR family oxidoreductase [unclassified Bilifractor]|uniref:SDR family oxidoreductase n=1 Tax=unclassified Bilifractor TaxID=2815795 RepID=UPI002A1622ED|nr:SDR family oxidoreductase [Eubacterium sp.]MDD6362828.1 SDR family oxidoreductase [Lachnospiraceae bacterium]MDY5114176.1 SDR family oxidoreductase [Bilifractor sp.]
MDYSLDINDKVAVVTGAGGVLCGMFSKVLAEQGAKVALLDLNQEAAQKVADEICASGGIAKAYKANVLELESLKQVHEQVLTDLGSCDILLNGAGGNNKRANTDKEYFEPGDEMDPETVSFFDLDPQGVQFVFSLNFIGTLLPTQVFAKDMIGKKNVSIINISSMNAFTPLTKIPAYSGAKAAISNFTQWLAVHFSRAGIRVNALAPGFFVTNQNRDLLFDADGNPTARTKKILAATPMNRFGEPEELNGTLLYLLNEKMSGFVTGVVIPIDGGFSAYSGV